MKIVDHIPVEDSKEAAKQMDTHDTVIRNQGLNSTSMAVGSSTSREV